MEPESRKKSLIIRKLCKADFQMTIDRLLFLSALQKYANMPFIQKCRRYF
jgi:hypothetical protein